MNHQVEGFTDERLLTFQQVCSLVSTSQSTLRRHIRKGTFPAPVKPLAGGRMVRFRFEDVKTWLDNL